MKLKKTLSLLLGVLFAACLFCGCDKTGDVSKNPETPTPETPDPPQDTTVYSVSLEAEYFLLAGDEEAGRVTLSPVVKAGKTVLDNAVCAYSVEDDGIASVDEAGVVTAAAYGTTTVTATYTAESGKTAYAKAAVKVFTAATAEEVNSFDEKYVNLYGRMDNSEGVVNIDNCGSGIEVAFYGTELKAKLTVTQPTNGMKIFGHVFLDGEMQEFTPFVSGESVVLAEDLEEGVHVAALHKSSEINEGRIAVKQFYADRFLRIPEKSDFKMEFIGDSITCGYGDLLMGASGIVRNSENSDACLSYAFLTGKQLNADFSIISYSGIGVKADRWGAGFDMTDLHTYTSLQTKTPYRYDADMDVVVLNLGTNDASYIKDVQPSYRKQFPVDYKDFLTHLREIYPDAYIVCAYGMMGSFEAVDKGIKQAVEEMNDSKISYKKFTANTAGVNGHPYYTAHASYAKQLVAYIETLLAE